jgi:fructose-1,6-bisphosphatase
MQMCQLTVREELSVAVCCCFVIVRLEEDTGHFWTEVHGWFSAAFRGEHRGGAQDVVERNLEIFHVGNLEKTFW